MILKTEKSHKYLDLKKFMFIETDTIRNTEILRCFENLDKALIIDDKELIKLYKEYKINYIE